MASIDPISNYQPGSTIGNAANLHRNVHELICNRMLHLTLDHVARLFRELNQYELRSPAVCKELHDMIYKNLIVPDDALMKRFKLSMYTPTTRVSHWYFVRSWQYSVQDFTAVLDDFTLDKMYGSIIKLWRTQLEKEKHLKTVYIRYAGQTSDARSRLLTATEIPRRNGFMVNFFKKTRALGIQALTRSTLVFEEDSLTFDRQNTTYFGNESRDLFEQAVISLFNLDALFNSQPGGITQKFVPSEPYRQEYLESRPQFFAKLNLYTIRYPDALDPLIDFLTYRGARNLLDPWLASIQELHQRIALVENGLLDQGELEQNYLESIMQLATPVGSVFSHHLMVMVGEAITERAFHGAYQITDATSSNAAYLLSDMLSHLEAWERNHNAWNPQDTRRLTGVIPFINLAPWLSKS